MRQDQHSSYANYEVVITGLGRCRQFLRLGRLIHHIGWTDSPISINEGAEADPVGSRNSWREEERAFLFRIPLSCGMNMVSPLRVRHANLFKS